METPKTFNYEFSTISKLLIDLILIFGPNLAFISQIIKFRKSKSSQGFSKIICLLILSANILRIFFWYGKRFDIPLLYQSIVSIIMQFILIHECLNVSKENFNKKFISNSFKNINKIDFEEDNNSDEENDKILNMEEFDFVDDNEKNINDVKSINEEDIKLKFGTGNKKKSIHENKLENNVKIIKENNEKLFENWSFSYLKSLANENGIDDLLNPKIFWNWPYIIDYIFFCLFFSIITAIIFAVFGFHNNYFIEGIGYFSLIIEATIGIPQIIENFRNKSTKNLAFFMIFIWLTGDTLKTLYFFKFKAPMQFILCGFFQMIVDCFIIFQINFYN